MRPVHYRTVYVSMCLALLAVACAPKTSDGEGASGSAAPAATEEQLAAIPEDDTCNAARYAHLIGRPIDMPGMIEPSADLRHILPDSQVTMDFRPERVNFRVNEDGRIAEITCG